MTSSAAVPFAPRQIVFVLGPQRSGTSLITQLIGTLLGSLPSDPIPAHDMNEGGFWEPAEVVAIHETLLAHLGSSWNDLHPWDLRGLQQTDLKGYKDRLWTALGHNFEGKNTVVLKDPRICRLLPLWLSLAAERGVRTAALLVIRHPLESAQSMGVRFDLNLVHAVLLWARYSQEAELCTRDIDRTFLSYDAVIQDWRTIIAPAIRLLGSGLINISSNTAERLEAIVRPDLKTFTFSERHRLRIPGPVARLYKLLVQAVHSDLQRGEADSIYSNVEDLTAQIGELIKLDACLRRSRSRDTQKTQAYISNLEHMLAEKDGYLAEIEPDVAIVKAYVAQLEAHAAEAKGYIADLEANTTEAQGYIADLEANTTEAKGYIAKLETYTAEARAYIAKLEKDIAEGSASNVELQNELNKARTAELLARASELNLAKWIVSQEGRFLRRFSRSWKLALQEAGIDKSKNVSDFSEAQLTSVIRSLIRVRSRSSTPLTAPLKPDLS